MEASLKYKVSEIFTRYSFSKEDAQFISEVLNEIDDRQNQKFELSKELFLTQKDKVDLLEKINTVNKSIYIVGIVQFLAIVASVLAIVNFMLK